MSQNKYNSFNVTLLTPHFLHLLIYKAYFEGISTRKTNMRRVADVIRKRLSVRSPTNQTMSFPLQTTYCPSF